VLNLPFEHEKTSQERRRLIIHGTVQGTGFRPFVYRLAMMNGLHGWVQNNGAGVIIEVEGHKQDIAVFISLLHAKKPTHVLIDHFESIPLALRNDKDFKIIQSNNVDEISATILPDLAVCADCLREMSNPADRRYRYPFINCTNCGPRYTIMTALPYDRSHTSMAGFVMCEDCLAEYKNPLDRRYHAQPIACPNCGPYLELWDSEGSVMATYDEALMQTVSAIHDGKIIALKGLGGFHLIVNARNENAVQLIRTRKQRRTKPFAVMYPSLEEIKDDCFVSAEEEKLLLSAAAPIVLLRRKRRDAIADDVSESNPYLGVMLPYTPLHFLLLQELKCPVIATSGNRANEPICIDENEALEELSGIVDFFLIHNRPIVNRSDDSIIRFAGGEGMVLRRARGYAPLPIMMKKITKQAILAVGGHLKNTIAFAKGNRLMLSSHIGDLDTLSACVAHEKAINIFAKLYHDFPEIVVHDAHPDYCSTQIAQSSFENCLSIQHHYAHALSCMVDNGLEAPCFAVVWDGNGYGDDGTIWGGEFLNIYENSYERITHFLPFPLPGGEAAIRDLRRTALGVVYSMQADGECVGFSDEERFLLWQAMEKNVNAPLTSSVGRLFDAVAALIELCQKNSFEGEAAMMLEFAAMRSDSKEVYEFEIKDGIIDWKLMMFAILGERKKDKSMIARKFHNTLAAIIIAVAQKQMQKCVLLTGGCFQNKLLLESAINGLRESGFEPYWHKLIPPNDGGLAAGQILAALRKQQ